MLQIELQRFGDQRGWFMEAWNDPRYRELGIGPFVQMNVSRSAKGVLRGLHFQQPNPQGKLVMCLEGEVWDVGVDINPNSPTFRKHWGAMLSESNSTQLWIPPGFAHGFEVLSENALFVYLVTAAYDGPSDRGIRWDDPALGIPWQTQEPQLSNKDKAAPTLSEFLANG